MDHIKLNNGYEIPVIGYGTFPQKETLSDNVVNAYRSGYRLFDTSDNYHNEAFIGEGLKKINADECTVITKYSVPGNEAQFGSYFQKSKEKLGEIDIYLLHWPYPFLWKYQWRQMEKLYLEGKVKAIGVCNFELNKLKALMRICKVPPVIDQIERHPLFRQQEIFKYCKANNIQIMCYSPVARADSELMNAPALLEIAKKYDKTVSQVILRWDIDTGAVPIPGSSSEKHIVENIDVFDFQLTEDEIRTIDGLDKGKRIRFDPKKRFNLKQKIRFFIYRARLLFKH